MARSFRHLYGPEPIEQPIDIGPDQMNTKAAAQYVRDRKLAEPRAQAGPEKPRRTRGEFLALIALLRQRVGELAFASEMERHGKLIHELTPKEALEFYQRLVAIAGQETL